MLSRTLIIVAGLTLPLVAHGQVLAQDARSGSTETNLGSAGQFRNITSTGVTKPPGGGGPDSENRVSDQTRKQQAIDRKVETGICIGCN